MKNVSRNKFLLCFRPVVDMDLVLETEGGVDRSRKSQALKYITAENKFSVSRSDPCSNNSDDSMMVRRPSQQNFSKVIRAVLFETILAKRVRDRKNLSQDSYKSSSRSFSRQKSMDSISGNDKSVNNRSSVYTGIEEIKTNPVFFSQASIGSSSSSSSSTVSPSKPKRQKQNNNNKGLVERTKTDHMMGSSWSFNYAISLLLLSLSVTILWGKLCAILFTSIWLYFLRHEQSDSRSDEEVKKLTKGDESKDYKKRIIMEGLLERNHHRENALNF